MSELPPDTAQKILAMFDFPHGDVVAEKLAGSSDRIRRAFAEQFSGYGLNAEEVLNETVRTDSYDGIVCVQDVSFYSACEHHFAPFFGTADVAYQPGRIITGLGKLVRVVRDVHARRLQIQELMTRDIAEDVSRVLGAKGVLVRTRARHLCVCSRGPGDDNAQTEVIYGVGAFAGRSTWDF